MNSNSKLIPFSTIFQALTLCLLIWLSSGTLAPYAATVVQSLKTLPCNYLVSIDHPHFLSTFCLLDGGPKEYWSYYNLTLRRILYPFLAYPWMKLLGYELGGLLFNGFSHVLVLILFSRLMRRISGAEAAYWGGWLFATYPGIFYWAGLPYSYAAIVPASLLLIIIMYRLFHEDASLRLNLRSSAYFLGIGVLLTSYDLASFFASAVVLMLMKSRKWSLIPFSLLLMFLPQSLVNYWITQKGGGGFRNYNTEIYFSVLKGFFHPNYQEWFQSFTEGIVAFWIVFFTSNYVFIPALFLVILAIAFSKKLLKLLAIEKTILLCGFLIFCALNLTPPFPGIQIKGSWIARIYQPLIVVYLLFLSRFAGRFHLLDRKLSLILRGLFISVIVVNVSIVVGSVAGLKYPAYFHHLFYRHGGPTEMYEQLDKVGRRPYGFCAP